MDTGVEPEPPDSLETSRYRSREPQVGEEAGGAGGAETSPSTRELAMRSLRQNFPRAAAAYDEQAAALPPSSCGPSAPPADEGRLVAAPAAPAEPEPAAPPAAPCDTAADASAKPAVAAPTSAAPAASAQRPAAMPAAGLPDVAGASPLPPRTVAAAAMPFGSADHSPLSAPAGAAGAAAPPPAAAAATATIPGPAPPLDEPCAQPSSRALPAPRLAAPVPPIEWRNGDLLAAQGALLAASPPGEARACAMMPPPQRQQQPTQQQNSSLHSAPHPFCASFAATSAAPPLH